jgi:exodeoxyribonuclease-3
MKIVCFNINGIRAREHQLRAIKEKHDPDILALQETKVQDENFPVEMVKVLGFQALYHGQKSHYGVALLCKQQPLSVHKGFPGEPDDAQRRVIAGEFETASGQQLSVINGYYPQGENRAHPIKFPHKRQFYADMGAYIRSNFSTDQNLLVVGDMNVAPLDLDIGIGEDNAKRWLRTGKCSFLPEEREWLDTLRVWGLQDVYRQLYPQVNDRFSWFDYRSRGFERDPKRGLRIDLMLATPSLAMRCKDAGIDYDIRALEKPSDHCPVWVDLDI